MVDTVVEAVGWPINELGEIVASTGVGTANVIGCLSTDYVPIVAATQGLAIRLPPVVVGGDMTRSVYDPDDDGKIDIAQTTGVEPTLTKGNIVGTTNRISVTGGTGAVIGSGTTLTLPQDIHQEATPIFNGISFDTTPTPVTGEGVLSWDEEYQTLALQTGVPGVVLQVGQETHILCRNSTGGILTSGDIVYISGSDGEYPTIAKAIASNFTQSNSTIGMLTSSPANGELCMVTVLGIVHDVDTSAYAPGTVLYLSSSVAGGFSNIKVTTESTSVRLGWVVKQSLTQGEIFVSVQTEMNSLGYYLDAQTRTASVNIPTTPTPFVWSTEVADSLDGYDPATGIITLKFSGTYSFNFLYNTFTSGSSKQLYTAAQVYSGGTWVPLEYSTRQLTVAQGIKALSTFVSTNPFPAGTQLRFVTWASGTGVSIVTESPATGYTIAAARVLITGVKTV